MTIYLATRLNDSYLNDVMVVLLEDAVNSRTLFSLCT